MISMASECSVIVVRIIHPGPNNPPNHPDHDRQSDEYNQQNFHNVLHPQSFGDPPPYKLIIPMGISDRL